MKPRCEESICSRYVNGDGIEVQAKQKGKRWEIGFMLLDEIAFRRYGNETADAQLLKRSDKRAIDE